VEKVEINLTQEQARLCSARTRSGSLCRRYPIKGKKRCRLHGGLSPGAPKGNQNALKHGRYSRATLADERLLRAILRDMLDLERL
jgi:glucans biosynthesis protein